MRSNILYIIGFFLIPILGKSQGIIYEFPESVSKKIEVYISNFSDSTKFAIQLQTAESNTYIVYVIQKDFSNSEGAKLVNEMLIDRTNRFVRIAERLLPLITTEDFVFAYLGPGGKRKGKVGRKKVIQNFDGYSITFDASGKIHQ